MRYENIRLPSKSMAPASGVWEMRLRYKIPTSITITAPDLERLTLPEGHFEHASIRGEFRLLGEDGIEAALQPPPRRYIQFCHSLEITLSEDDGELARFVTEQNWESLANLVAKVANRILLSIRNFGMVAHIGEVKIARSPFAGVESTLRQWQVEVIDEAGQVQVLFPVDSAVLGFSLLLGQSAATPSGELEAFRWSDILEAVELDLRPGAHQEFLTNALEHARLGNLRYALLEAVICLEIMLTRFLRLSLQQKGLSNERISAFLTPQLGLTARVGVVLNLLLPGIDFGDVSNVLQAIRWRNELVHETGHLRESLTEIEIRRGIAAVVVLASILASKVEELAAADEMLRLTRKLGEEFGVSLSRLPPNIRAGEMHRVLVDFNYIVRTDLPQAGTMERIVARVSELLAMRDPRFEPQRHLTVRFLVLPNIIRARWVGGRLEISEVPPASTEP
jgi:hypothetical protein